MKERSGEGQHAAIAASSTTSITNSSPRLALGIYTAAARAKFNLMLFSRPLVNLLSRFSKIAIV